MSNCETLDLARALIARPSVTPADAGCLELIGDRLARIGFALERIAVGGVCNLWARRGREAPLVCFAGHTDVVPTGPLGRKCFILHLWRRLCDVKSYTNNDTPVSKMQEKFGYVDIQVMAGLTHSGFRLGVGPVAHILAHHTSDMTKMDIYNEKMRAISYGFSGSIGYDIDRFSFDVKYDKAFRSVGDHIYYCNKKSLFKETPDAITFSVGIALIK